MLRFTAAILALSILAASASESGKPTQLESNKLHNLFRVDRNLYSGSSPEDEEGFAELKALGVTTVISVDGSRPNVELAKKHGLKYVHLPIGYDGVPKDRVAELIKAASTSTGPVYVHCHHGKHRGPAAVAVVCEGTLRWSAQAAVDWLKQAGTADDYAGLYRDVREFKAPDEAVLAKLPSNFPEIAPTPPLIDTMVAVDDCFERLKAIQKNGWQPDGTTDARAALQQATLLWEQYREMSRMEDTIKRPADYRAKLAESEKAVDVLRQHLRAKDPTRETLDSSLKAISQQCTDCHRAYRNKRE